MNQKSLTLDSPLLFIYFNFFYIAQIVVIGLGTRCPPRDPSLPVSCSSAPHHVFPEGPLDEHGRNAVSYILDFVVSYILDLPVVILHERFKGGKNLHKTLVI